jgi:hypothetical protein
MIIIRKIKLVQTLLCVPLVLVTVEKKLEINEFYLQF